MGAVISTAAVHIGLPKAGSTAFQESLLAAGPALIGRGIRSLIDDGAVKASVLPTRAIGLAASVVRPGFDAWFRVLTPEAQLPGFVRDCADSVRRQAAAPEPHLVASMEDLCLVRTRKEVRTLVDLLAPREVSVVLVLRDTASYRQSLKGQLAKAGLRTWSPVPESCFNTAEDSWLFDQAALVDVLTQVLGPTSVTTIDYADTVAAEGSIVPALWRACGLPVDLLDGKEWGTRWTNVSSEGGGWSIDAEDDIEVLRDYALRLKVENDRIQLSMLWRVTRPLGRARHAILRRNSSQLP